LAGWVRNTSEGVVIEAQGERGAVDRFLAAITSEAPPLAEVTQVETAEVSVNGDREFVIRESMNEADPRARIPADVALCADCAREILDPVDRRYHYPFANCTNCGPRFTIIQGIPYDRPATTMASFTMCGDCRREYEEPGDRRFHAQPIACPACGPRLAWDGVPGDNDALLQRTAEALRSGEIVAIKGLGGYHLACDARRHDAVEELRRRKGRGGKPFALMAANFAEIRGLCRVDAVGERLLTSLERPIVLLPAREDGGLSAAVAPRYRHLGVMLPYTPLHELLMRVAPPTLVMTSGNLTEEPIAYRDADARSRLGHIADHFLSHDREIETPCDDSVVRPLGDDWYPLRRARGFAPRPIELGFEAPPVLACGAQEKNTFCLTQGTAALLGPHIGDLDNVETLAHYERCLAHLEALFRVTPTVVAHDLHPEYLSTKYALARSGIRRIGVQHHHAHIVSAMVDNGLEGRVIGVAFDGAGYGPDGTLWGGEFLIADYVEFTRAAHLAAVPLPGGAAAIHRPGRIALSYLRAVYGDDAATMAGRLLPALPAREVEIALRQMERGLNCPLTSGMGRLFDAVSALLGLCAEATYQGQAAIELELAAAPLAATPHAAAPLTEDSGCYPWQVVSDAPYQLHVEPMIAAIIADREAGVPTAVIARRFHGAIARLVVETCSRLREETGLDRVVLSGGVFQNVLLTEMLLADLPKAGLRVYAHRRVPPNDGGISLGQAAIAARVVAAERG
jgi:hydrogenase maturation protein HypF